MPSTHWAIKSSRQGETLDDNITETLFAYDNYRSFLKDYFEYKKRSTKYFSLRFFASKAGFSSHGYCAKVIRAESNLTHESASKICRAIKLPKRATEYFLHLVKYNQAKTFSDKQDHFLQLSLLRNKSEFYRVQEKQYAYFSSWHHQVVREVATYSHWKGDYAILGTLIMPPISTKEAEESVKMLVKTGFLKKMAGGKFKQAFPIVTGDGCPAHIVKRVRTQFLLKAIEAGEMTPKEERHLSYATMAISEKQFQEVSGMLDEVRKKILSITLDDSEVEKVYSLNFQLFPVAHTGPKNTIKHEGKK